MLVFGIIILLILVFVCPQEFVPFLKGMRLVEYTMLFVGTGWVFKSINAKNSESIFKAQQNSLMLLFWMSIVISTASVHWLSYSYTTFLEWGKVILIYFVLIGIVDTKRRLFLVIWVIILSMSLTAYFGILQHFGIDVTGVGLNIDNRIRGVGIFDTNQLAYTICFCAPFVISFILQKRGFISKIILCIIFFIYLYCIYLTQSRGGMLCIIFVVGMSAFYLSKKLIYKIIGVLSILFIYIFYAYSSRFTGALNYQDDQSALGRIDVWGRGLIALKSSPLFGIGKGQFAGYFGMAAHSSYIESVTELGIMGLFLWISLFYFSFKNLRTLRITLIKENKGENDDLVLIKSLEISLLAYLFGSLFSSSTYYLTLYIILGLVVIVQNIFSKRFPASKPVFLLKDFFIIFLFLVVIILSISFMARSS